MTLKIKRLSIVTETQKTIVFYTDADAKSIERRCQKAMGKGHQIEYLDGTITWYDDDVDFDATKTGVDAYTWDRRGDRVRHTRFLVTRTKDGKVTKTKLRSLYRAF